MLVQNKWNKKLYKVIIITNMEVTLEREDRSQFTIQKTDYFYNYSEKK